MIVLRPPPTVVDLPDVEATTMTVLILTGLVLFLAVRRRVLAPAFAAPR